MSRKITVRAPANIAFVKYWGARDLERALPYNPSVSMTLDQCVTHCTVEFREGTGTDEMWLVGEEGRLESPRPDFARRVQAHLDRLREWSGVRGSFRVATQNCFPSAAGLASSASGFAALTLAAVRALGLEPSLEELSNLARRSGSGSAARSVFGGYVEWPKAATDEEGYAFPLAPTDHWTLCDVIALVDLGPKAVSSLEGHRRAPTSPHFETRLKLLPERLETVRTAIQERDLTLLGEVLEEEAIDLHLIAMSSRPPIFYWKPGTLQVLEAVRQLRAEGVPAYSTMDAGANVHVLCPPEAEAAVAQALEKVEGVQALLRDRVGAGPVVETSGLF